MIVERTLGGESQGRSLFGGKRNRGRTIGLGIVFGLGLITTMVWQGPALVLSLLAGALVWVGTLNTHRGSLFKRIAARRRFKEQRKAGRCEFVPVGRRPAELTKEWTDANRKQRRKLATEWAKYRDWPDGVEGLNWLQSGVGEPGIMWHTPTGQEAYLSVCFPVRGQVQGLEGDGAINTAADRFGRLLSGWSSPTSLVSRVQMLTRVLPVDSARHEKWVLDNVDWQTPDRLLASYDDVVRQVGRGGLMQRHFAVVRWSITPAFLTAAARKGEGEEGWRRLLKSEIRNVQRRLHSARLQPGEALTAAQTAAVLRHMQMPSWPIDQAGDASVRNPWLASTNSWSTVTVRDVGPSQEEETWLHRTLRVPVEHIGTGERTPLWLLPFLTRLDDDVIRSISFELEPVPAVMARAQARADLSSDLADLYAQKSKGGLTDEELEVATQAVKARHADLRPGSGAGGVGYAIHASLSARDEIRLAEACAAVEEVLTTDLDIGRIEWLDPDQSSAVAACWPVARGMRPAERTSGDRLMSLLAGKGNKDSLT